jgi:hypothetical protein
MKKEDYLTLELSTLLEQYKSARKEIDSLLDASRQVVNLTFTVISLFIGISAFSNLKIPIVYLVFPLFLYAVAWVQLRHILLMRRLSAYIAESIAPKVRGIMRELSPQKNFDANHLLNWEEGWKSPGSHKGGFLLLPILGAGYGIPLFAAIVSLLIYLNLTPNIFFIDAILIVANITSLVYSAILGFLIEFRRFGQSL